MSKNNASRAFVALNTVEHKTSHETITESLKLPNKYIKQITNNTTEVTVNGMCGVIEMAGVELTGQSNARFSVKNSSVLATSRIFLQVESFIDIFSGATQGPHCCIDTIADGSFVISISNPDQFDCNTPRIHFLIVNNPGEPVYQVPS